MDNNSLAKQARGIGWNTFSFSRTAVRRMVDDLVRGKNLLCFSFVSGHQGLHDQGGCEREHQDFEG